MNRQYTVDLSATAFVSARVTVDAEDASEAEQKALAVANNGDAVWKYDGVEDDTAQVERVTVTGLTGGGGTE